MTKLIALAIAVIAVAAASLIVVFGEPGSSPSVRVATGLRSPISEVPNLKVLPPREVTAASDTQSDKLSVASTSIDADKGIGSVELNNPPEFWEEFFETHDVLWGVMTGHYEGYPFPTTEPPEDQVDRFARDPRFNTRDLALLDQERDELLKLIGAGGQEILGARKVIHSKFVSTAIQEITRNEGGIVPRGPSGEYLVPEPSVPGQRVITALVGRDQRLKYARIDQLEHTGITELQFDALDLRELWIGRILEFFANLPPR